MRRLMSPDLTQAEYAAIQSRFYGVFFPLERSLANAEAWSGGVLSFAGRSDALAADLRRLDVETATLPMATVTPVDGTRAVGRIYVLEGSRLGARLIRSQLATLRWFEPPSMGSFFAGEIPGRWIAIQQWIDDTLEHENQHAVEIAALEAVETFQTLVRWLKHDG